MHACMHACNVLKSQVFDIFTISQEQHNKILVQEANYYTSYMFFKNIFQYYLDNRKPLKQESQI